MKKQKNDLWIKICLLPFIIGFALVVADMSMMIFKMIGWVLLIFGIITGLGYLRKLYKTHEEWIKEFYRKVKIWRKKPEQLSDKEVDKKMEEREDD